MARIPGLAPRFAAWRILHDVRHGVPFDTALKRALDDLEPDDRRLAHEMAAGVFRNRSALDAALAPSVERGITSVRADTLDALRVGAFQLLHLDKVPPHAAVQTTVGIARRLGGRRVGGFVNAVLRRMARTLDGADHRPTPAGDMPAAPPSLADRFSHPAWLVDRWTTRFGHDDTERLLAWNNTPPPLVLQPARWTVDALEVALGRAGITHRRLPYDAGITVEARRPTDLPGFAEGGFYVQDPAQALVTRSFDIPAGGVVYDACAAPGGKSLSLARSARLVVAADRQRLRIRRLRENIRRAATGAVLPVIADAMRPPLRGADAVVLDVPCLGTGTFARKPDARWRVTETALAHLATQAAGFLDAAAEVVTPGGLLLFATCSLEPEENQHQIDGFLARDGRFRREPSAAVPVELLTPSGDLMILPQRHAMDGAYATRLRRVAV